ncbi:MAG: hypothetical protein H7Z13_07225 [Ferruginibacter sp.]|nr:hypothetical protein [Ferruginibacter sp.]
MKKNFTNFFPLRWSSFGRVFIAAVLLLVGNVSYAQPSNDDCDNAVALVQGTTCSNTAGTTVAATQSMAATPCFGTPDDDVWYSFVAVATDAQVTLSSITGTSTDMYFQVLSGNCGSTFTSLLCSDPNSGIVGGLTVGQTYFVRVYTYSSAASASYSICVNTLTVAPTTCGTLSLPAANATVGGTPVLTWSSATNATAYDIYLDAVNPPATIVAVSGATSYSIATALAPGDYFWYVRAKNSVGGLSTCATNTRKFTVVAPPANDNCDNAVSLVQEITCTNTSGTTVGGTLSMAATPCFGSPDDDVWYSFVAVATEAQVALSTVSGSTDMYFQVLSGDCGSLTSVLCSDPNSGIVTGLTVGQTYFVRVYTYASSNSATFNICVNKLALPTTCGTLSSPAANTSVNTTPVLTWSSATNATGYDIYLDGNNPPTSLVASVGITTSYTVTPALTPGDYYWYVEAKNTTGSALSCAANARKFTVVAPPANDDCANAISLTQGASCVNTLGTTTAATLSMAASPCFGNPDDDVWYSFVATATSAIITITNVSGVTDMYFQVLSGTCGSSASLLCSDPQTGTVTGLTIGQTYLIRVYTYAGSVSSTFNICLTSPPLPPANDNCASAVLLTQGTSCVNTQGTTAGATLSMAATPCFGNPDDDVWYSFVATATSAITTITNVSGETDMYFQVLSGTCASPVSLLCSDPQTGTVTGLTIGQTYLLRVYTYSGSVSSIFNICLTSPPPPPANDLPAGAITLTVDANCTAAPYTNVSGTVTTNEPRISCKGSQTLGAIVWFKFVAPASGSVRVSTDVTGNGLTDTRLGLFSTTNPADLSTYSILVCDDDNGTTVSAASIVYAAGLTPGTTYYVGVDQYDGASTGTFCVQVHQMTSAMVAPSGACTAGQSLAAYLADYKGWLSLTNSAGLLIANVRSNTTLSGTATYAPSLNVNTGAVRVDGTGKYYLDRNFRITNTLAGNYNIQFFFLNTEFTALQTASPSTTLAGLNVTRVKAETACNANFTSGGAVNDSLLIQTGSGTANGISWVGVTVPGFSNFYLHSGITVLPVSLEYIKGAKSNAGNLINWKVNCTSTHLTMVLERSGDARGFTAISTITAEQARCSQPFYFTDVQPLKGISYYRLKMVDVDGTISYSVVVALINAEKGIDFVGMYPTIVKNTAVLSVAAAQAGKIQTVITDITGRVMKSATSAVISGSNLLNIDCSTLAVGVYNITGYVDGVRTKTIRFTKM